MNVQKAGIVNPISLQISRFVNLAMVSVTMTGCGASLQTIKVPVPVECRETTPDRPAMPTEQFTSKPTLDQYVQASQAEIERREGYELRLVAALQACTLPITEAGVK